MASSKEEGEGEGEGGGKGGGGGGGGGGGEKETKKEKGRKFHLEGEGRKWTTWEKGKVPLMFAKRQLGWE